jgi:hypothetical protein
MDRQGNQLHAGGLPLFFADEGGQLRASLQRWLDLLAGRLGNTGNSLLPVLFISGLIKLVDCC